MQAIKLTIEDSIYSRFMGLLEILPKGSVTIEPVEDTYPSEVVVSSVAEVRARVYAAEQQEGIGEAEYEKMMKTFFKEELGVDR